jgi:hypothetical protein
VAAFMNLLSTLPALMAADGAGRAWPPRDGLRPGGPA